MHVRSQAGCWEHAGAFVLRIHSARTRPPDLPSGEGCRGVRRRHRDLECDLRERGGTAVAYGHLQGAFTVDAEVSIDGISQLTEGARIALSHRQRDLALLLVQQTRRSREHLSVVLDVLRMPLVNGMHDRSADDERRHDQERTQPPPAP